MRSNGYKSIQIFKLSIASCHAHIAVAAVVLLFGLLLSLALSLSLKCKQRAISALRGEKNLPKPMTVLTSRFFFASFYVPSFTISSSLSPQSSSSSVFSFTALLFGWRLCVCVCQFCNFTSLVCLLYV